MTSLEDWAARWAAGQIGFHEGAPNELLVRHGHLLVPAGAPERAARPRVLVPLCGKAHDLAWLAHRGFDVVGVEAVEHACRAYFDERGAAPTTTPRASGVAFTATRVDDAAVSAVSLVCADFFACGAPSAATSPADPLRPGFAAAYDRAALVAVPPERRAEYVGVLAALLALGAPLLLVSFEYDQARADGPPWSLPDGAVRELFAARFEGALVEEREVAMGNARLAAAGVKVMTERAYLLRRRAVA